MWICRYSVHSFEWVRSIVKIKTHTHSEDTLCEFDRFDVEGLKKFVFLFSFARALSIAFVGSKNWIFEECSETVVCVYVRNVFVSGGRNPNYAQRKNIINTEKRIHILIIIYSCSMFMFNVHKFHQFERLNKHKMKPLHWAAAMHTFSSVFSPKPIQIWRMESNASNAIQQAAMFISSVDMQIIRHSSKE